MAARHKSRRRKAGRHQAPATPRQEVESWFLEPDEGRLRLTGGRMYASGLDVEAPRAFRRVVRRIGLGLLLVRDRVRRRGGPG